MSSPGEVWLADLGARAKVRPVLVLSKDDPESPWNLFTFVPLTHSSRGGPYEVPLPKLPWLNMDSVINSQGIATLDKVYLMRKLGQVDSRIMVQVKKALQLWLPLLSD